jgi:outer membrane protein TolC
MFPIRFSVLSPRAREAGGTVLLVLVVAGCTPAPPRLSGAPATARTPDSAWVPPPGIAQRATTVVQPVPLPADLESRIRSLTLTDVLDVALRNNPTTQSAWANARAAAAAYGAAHGAYYPTIDLNGSVIRLKTVASQGRVAVQQTLYSSSATFSWLLLDLGGRSGATEAARQALLAADWNHNAVLQNVVLQVESAYFLYSASVSLVTAQRSAREEAAAGLAAAEARHEAGLATIADVLQARTALAQADLSLESTEGQLQTSRGSLAVSMGLPATLPYEIAPSTEGVTVGVVADSVQALVATAVRLRPDLASATALEREAAARVGELRAQRLPSLSLSGNTGYQFIPSRSVSGANYSLTLGLTIPVFNGFTREYNQQQAEALAQAAAADTRSLQQQVIFQVFSAYYTLQTSARRVHTSETLLESAQASQQVALARYKAGVGTVLDLLTAQTALANARAQQVQARLDWSTALAQLSHDAGLLDLHGTPGIRLSNDSTLTRPEPR